jgi:Tfp pilus assembly protein PilO
MSGRTRMILTGVGVALVCAAFFFFFIRSRQADLADVKTEIAQEQSRTLELQAELARLKDLQANAPQLEAELARIRQLVPQSHQVPNFIFQVQEAANQSGVSFVQITPELPKTPPEGASVAEVRMGLSAGGGYFAIQDFIRRLYALDRAVRIDTLNLTVETTEGGGTDLSLVTSTRIFFELPVAPGAATTTPTGTTPAPGETAAPAESPVS